MFSTKMTFDKSYYLPAYSVTGLVALEKGSKTYTGKNFRFYEESRSNIFDYPGFLVSAGHRYKDMDLKEKLNLNFDKNILLGDSGGYQIATGVIDFSNREQFVQDVFKWLEKNSNFALNIDIPLYINVEGSSEASSMSREDKIKISKEHFDYFQKNQSGSTKYLNVLHGRSLQDLDFWYDFVKDYKFEGGWAIGSVTIDIFYILQSFFFLFHNGEVDKIKNKNNIIHLLGMSKSEYIIYVEYLQKKLNDAGYNISITYDSSTPDITAGMGSYVLDVNYNSIQYLHFSKTFTDLNLDSLLPCQCPVCKGITYRHFYGEENRNDRDGFKTLTYNHMSFHNLYKMLEYIYHIKNIINSNSNNIYTQIFNERVLYILSIIDYCFEHKDYQSFLLKQKYNIMSTRKAKYDLDFNRKKLF